MSFPIVFAREPLAALLRVVAAWYRAMELLLLFVAIVDVSLKMSLGSKSLGTVRVRTFVIPCVISLMVPDEG